MIRVCPQVSDCPAEDISGNFSSEASDTLDYITTFYGTPRTGLTKQWNRTECGVTFISDISQLDANLQAAAAALSCSPCVGPDCNPPPPGTTIICNTPQTCGSDCGDGSSSTYTLPGGLFCNFDNQQSADSAAHNLACQLSRAGAICIGPLTGCVCVGDNYNATLTATSLASWTFDGGSLPPGVAFAGGVGTTTTISGMPTTPGQYTFAIRATSGLGTFVSKRFTITVIQITTTSLPGFTIGTPYSFQLVATGGSGSYNWKIKAGALPAGLTMSLTGLISGTPTASGTNPITFSVIDTACESADQTFFPPAIKMTTKSTTQIATILGWSEFPGFVSTPPKKFMSLVFTGSSEQQLWYRGVQIGGARYDFGDESDTIDEGGNITSTHTKFLSVMCNGATNRAAIVGGTSSLNANYSNAVSFLGYFGTNSTFIQPPCLINPTELCTSSSIPYASVGDKAEQTPFSAPQADLTGLWGSSFLGSSEQLNFVGNALVTISSNTTASSSDNGTSNVNFSPYAIPLINPADQGVVTTGLYLESFSSLVTPCGNIPRPPDWNASAQVIFINSFSATLEDEYTDAIALANAQVIVGNGATAQNSPRTTGFVSQFTNVVFTLNASNLIANTAYTISVDLADLTAGTVTTKQYGIMPTGTTSTITDIIPTPAAGHFVQVRNARITFA